MILRVGDVVSTTNSGDAVIVELNDNHAIIKFNNTGNLKLCKRCALQVGHIKDKGPSVSDLKLPPSKRGSAQYGIRVGDIHRSNYWGDTEIVEVVRSGKNSRVVVKFINTGNLQECKYREVANGCVKDAKAFSEGVPPFPPYPSPKMDASYIAPGTTYASNHFGMMEVVEYRTGKDILIRFLDTGHELSVQKYALINGQVHDVQLKKQRTESRLAEESRNKELRESSRQKELERLAAEKAEKRAAEDEEKAKAKLQKELEKRANEDKAREDEDAFLGTSYFDKLGYEYTVIERVKEYTWKVKYTETGNTYDRKQAYILKNQVHDLKHPNYHSLIKKYNASVNALKYDSNREENIAKSKQYQKDNPDKVSTRNRNRRARRLGAQGTHTYEDTMKMLYDQDNMCKCCNADLTKSKHLDHIMPLALGGSNDISNLQWLCPFCNNSKGHKHPDEWNLYVGSAEFKSRASSRQQILN